MSSISLRIATSELRAADPSVNPANFVFQFNPPLDLKSLAYQVAFVKGTFWNSVHNVIGKTIKWSSNGGSSWTTITIPNGQYSVDEVNALLRISQYNAGVTDVHPVTGAITYGIDILPNYNTNKVDIRIDNTVGSGNTFHLDLSDAGDATNLREYLGFPDAVVTATSTGTSIAQVDGGIDSWLIQSDLVSNSFSNGKAGDVLYHFKPNAPANAAMEIEPIHLSYLQVNRSLISQMRIKVTDQNGNVLNLQDEDIVLHLQIIPMKDY